MDMFIFHKDHAQFRSFVYRNLAQDCWSVKALEGPNAGRVVLHAKYVAISGDAEFRVSEAGRARVVREGRKNVHAGVVGSIYWADVVTERYPTVTSARATYPDDYEPDVVGADHTAYREVAYNPYKFSEFVWADTLEAASISDTYDQSVVLDAGMKVYVMSFEELGRVTLAKMKDREAA